MVFVPTHSKGPVKGFSRAIWKLIYNYERILDKSSRAECSHPAAMTSKRQY
jgi:hypothetical protein